MNKTIHKILSVILAFMLSVSGFVGNYRVKAETTGAVRATAQEGLVTDLSQLTNGSHVVIYNPGHKLAMTSNIINSDWYLEGAQVTIEDDKVVDPAENLIWEVSVNNGVYTFSQGEKKVSLWLNGNYAELTSNASHAGVDTGWKVTERNAADHLYLIYSNTLTTSYGNSYIEVYEKTINGVKKDVFCGYSTGTSRLNDKDYGMQFYLVAQTYSVTVEETQHGTVTVSKNSVSDGEVIIITAEADEGYELAEILINGVDFYDDFEETGTLDYIVHENIVIKAKFVEKTGLVTDLTELVAGSHVVIYNPGHKLAMTSNIINSDWYLEGAQVTIEDDKVVDPAENLIWEVSVNNGVYTFSQGEKKVSLWLNGNYAELTSNASHAGVDTGWKVTERNAADHLYLIYSNTLTTSYGNSYIEVYEKTINGVKKDVFCGYSTGTSRLNDKDYGMQFYLVANSEDTPIEPTDGTKYGLASTIEDGDKVIIYQETAKVGLGNTIASHKITGVSLTPVDDVITTDETSVVWEVTKNADDTYTFKQGDYTLGGVVSGQYNNLVVSGATYTKWTLQGPAQADFNTFMYLGEMTSNFGKVYLEYYNGFTLYGSNSPTAEAYGVRFYKQGAEPETPGTPAEGETYGLTGSLSTGDKVIIYQETAKVGLGNTIASHKITGVSLTPVDDVITTDETSVVWEVTKNADGTYTFKQGDYTLGGVVSGQYNNLVVSGATYTKWTLQGPAQADFNTFMYLGEMTSNFGKVYLEYYNGFTLYGSNNPSAEAYGVRFYKQGAEPETPTPQVIGNLVTDLDEVPDGATVAIYSPGHMTAISSKPNGDWYLRAKQATVQNGEVVNFTPDMVWIMRKNADGTYSFYGNEDPDTRSISVWRQENYAEVTVDYITYPENKWILDPAKTEHCFYAHSPTVSGDRGPAYLEAYVRNEEEVFSGYFTTTSSNKFEENEFALQFYLVDPDDAVDVVDDGEWDGILQPGEQYVAYNLEADLVLGLFKEANYTLEPIAVELRNGLAYPENGAYAFTIDSMGRYYSFEVNGKYLASNDKEELYFLEKNADGTLSDYAKWYLVEKTTEDGRKGYVIYNKEARFRGTSVCIEYYSSVFSGWTFSKNNPVSIYLFQFYKVGEDVKVIDNVVHNPKVQFECEDTRCIEQDYPVVITLADLAEQITSITITYTVDGVTREITDYETSAEGKVYSFTLPASAIDNENNPESFKINVEVTNSLGLSYSGEKVVQILDEPFFEDFQPTPNSQTRDEKRPVISVRAGNVGENPEFTMTINGRPVEAVYENGRLTYTPAEDLADGRVVVEVKCTRADGKETEAMWPFIVGVSEFQLYFGQLHSHTAYSDGSGSLETALDHIASLPASANVQFVAFTDHSNSFDTESNASPAEAMHDKSKMTDAPRALWETYKNTIAEFNSKHTDIIAIGGYEMTWSGGPGHINSFNTDGLVSRNNAALNNKNNDAGMKLYYETIKADPDKSTLHQFNHPGTTFGNFTDFAYRDDEIDALMYMVEVGNGAGPIGQTGYYPSYEQYIMALDNGWHLAPTNNQDNHAGEWGNANDARDVVLTNDFSEEGIYEAIRNLRMYATEDKNLQISYTINGEVMGHIFSDEETPENLNVNITVYDPDSKDSISKVELVANGGVVAYEWNNADDIADGSLEATISPDYSYYFVRVTQADKDLAVTSPIWVGNALKVGIESFNTSDGATEVALNEPVTLVTNLFNNEDVAATVKSLTYTVNGSEILNSDTTERTINANGTLEVKLENVVFDQAKEMKITVTAVIEFEGKEYTFTKSITLDVVDPNETVSTIKEVRDASVEDDTGYRFVIEGVVTSNTMGVDVDRAFFDCIYVQDETAGICVFPVANTYKIGDKVRIIGHTDFYQGEPELQVSSIELISENNEVTPKEITAAELNDRSAEGWLVKISGTVDSFEVQDGLIQTIMIKDAAGNLARVFIDGYITKNNEVENCVVGANITAIGEASYDNTFNSPDGPYPRIRIRDRADVICEAIEVEYNFVEGAETTWTKGSTDGLHFVVKRNVNDELTFDNFKTVKVDDQEIAAENYSAVAGSLELTLKPEYLETVEAGEHKLTVEFEDGEAETTFKIKEAAEEQWTGPEWKWSDDYSAATATFTSDTGDTVELPAEVTVETKPDGTKIYTATVEGPDGETYTDTVTIMPLGDNSHLGIYIAMMVASAAGAYIVIRKKDEFLA